MNGLDEHLARNDRRSPLGEYRAALGRFRQILRSL